MAGLAQLVKNNELTKTNLLKFKKDINNLDDGCYTPLHWAVIMHKQDIAKLLINEGADLNIKSGKLECTALHIAIMVSDFNIAELLINKKAALSIQDNNGSTPLHMAAIVGDLEIIKLLINKKAALNIRDHDKKTAYDLAIDNNHIDIADTIRAELTNSVIKIYTDTQILGKKLPSVASHLNESKLFKLNTYTLEAILKNIDNKSLESLKESCTIKLYTELNDNIDNNNTDMPAIGGESSIDDNAQ